MAAPVVESPRIIARKMLVEDADQVVADGSVLGGQADLPDPRHSALQATVEVRQSEG